MIFIYDGMNSFTAAEPSPHIYGPSSPVAAEKGRRVMGCWHTTDAVVVTISAAAITETGLDWATAVTTLPSLDSPDMHAWIAGHHDPAGELHCAVVTPNDRHPDGLLPLPHRQICVPPHEYAAFTTMLADRSCEAT
ncbi:hypothetical protein [Nocardia sp. JMUB6875]|uniref:hypothetical protein n=1 Tax=Nocardia sp. JMUB6875 TaxID=3158170 RepID=UPI0034E886F1